MFDAPFGSEKVKVSVSADPLPLGGDTEIVAGGCGAVLPGTVSDAVALCVNAPLVPLTVIVTLPAAAELPGVTVSVESPDPETAAGLKLAEAPAAGRGVLRSPVPANPLLPITVTVYIVLDPGAAVCDPGEMLSEKSPAGNDPVTLYVPRKTQPVSSAAFCASM